MRLNNFTSLDHFIDDELYNYMCCTLFELQIQHENAYLFEKILNKETNLEIIQSINFDSLNFNQDEFMKILNEHIDTKVNKKKPELIESIKLKDGVDIFYYGNDIKHITIALNKTGKKIFPKDSYTALSDGKIYELEYIIEGKTCKVVQ